MPRFDPLTPADAEIVAAQLGREARGVAGVAWRCPCGKPGVVATTPRLPDGTPFPTTYYLTCPRAVSGCSTLEAAGVMAELAGRLAAEPDLAAGYALAHVAYLADRAELGSVAEIEGISAGGMPHRVKCLHVLAGHALAAGPGVNPLGDETLARLGPFWNRSCLAGQETASDTALGAASETAKNTARGTARETARESASDTALDAASETAKNTARGTARE